MKVFTKILASIGLFLLYGLLNQLVLMANGRTSGPSGALGLILAVGFIAGVVAIWRSKSPAISDSDKLDKRVEDGV
jgi:fructose-specific phosphotransferase system IIC component